MMPERSFVLRTKQDIERAYAYILTLVLDPDHPWELVVKLHKLKRTLIQNKRYHAVCAEIADQLVVAGRTYSPDSLKEYFKRTFIGTNEVPMPDGSVAVYGLSTTTLNTGEFADYMTKVDVWATENGVIFEVTKSLLAEYAREAEIWKQRNAKRMERESA